MVSKLEYVWSFVLTKRWTNICITQSKLTVISPTKWTF